MNDIRNRLIQLIKEGKSVLSTRYRPINLLHPMQQCPHIVNEQNFLKWRFRSLTCLDEILIHDDIRFKKFDEEVSKNNPSDTMKGISILESIIDDMDSGVFKLKNKNKPHTSKIEILELIFNNFHTIAKQLTHRREDRPTLHIDDEYDVQDLLKALLVIPFDDIRPEEWTPSYGGKSSRMDFLIKDENIVIETKNTRKNLTDNKLIEELIIDTSHYSKHPDCDILYCFVYDVDEFIKNPKAIENDLSGQKDGLEVKVMIRPQR